MPFKQVPRLPFCTPGQTRLSDIVQLTHPDTTMSFDTFVRYINGLFVMKMKDFRSADGNASHFAPLSLKGQMALIGDKNYMMYSGV